MRIMRRFSAVLAVICMCSIMGRFDRSCAEPQIASRHAADSWQNDQDPTNPRENKYENQQEVTISDFSDTKSSAEQWMHIHFSTVDTHQAPYVKKHDQFVPTWQMGTATSVSSAAKKLMPSVAKLGAESFRVDMFMGLGGIGGLIGDTKNNDGSKRTNYLAMDAIDIILNRNGMNPYYVYFANPTYSGGGSNGEDAWKSAPDLEKWATLCKNIAQHFKDNGIRLGGHEIWNEPDWGTAFYSGTWEEYIDLYIAGAKAIRSADADALIGGLSSAEIHNLDKAGKVEEFLNAVRASEAPLDFVSWHYYGRKGRLDNSNNSFGAYLQPLRRLLDEEEAFSTVQQHLNEFNIYAPGSDPIYKTYNIVTPMFEALERLAMATDVTRVYWACTFGGGENGHYLINSDTGERYPQYHALWCYQRLPVTPVLVEQKGGSAASVMAASDGQRAGVILYNTAYKDKQYTLLLDELPFRMADLAVYVIDDEMPTALTSDEPYLLEAIESLETVNLAYEIVVPAKGAVYIEISDGSGTSLLDEDEQIGTIVRKDYWYKQRGDCAAGSEFDESSLMGHVWTGAIAEDHGTAVAITVDEVTQNELTLITEVSGAPEKLSESSALGFCVDYEVEGVYVKRVFYAWEDLCGNLATPLGATEIEAVIRQLLPDEMKIDLTADAPENWSGRIMIQLIADEVGKDVLATFKICTH